MGRNMIAPYGLNCAICSEALQKNSPYVGCQSKGYKSEHYASLYKIVKCEIRKALSGGFYDGCPRYPCREIVDKECWHANAYPMVESLMGDLTFMKENDIKKFLQREDDRRTCSGYGGCISIHDGVCHGCGENYTNRGH